MTKPTIRIISQNQKIFRSWGIPFYNFIPEMKKLSSEVTIVSSGRGIKIHPETSKILNRKKFYIKNYLQKRTKLF